MFARRLGIIVRYGDKYVYNRNGRGKYVNGGCFRVRSMSDEEAVYLEYTRLVEVEGSKLYSWV